MSARNLFPHDTLPDHLARWLEASQGGCTPNSEPKLTMSFPSCAAATGASCR